MPATILVVEDEPLFRMNIADQLQDLGFDVLKAANARDAVTMLLANDDIRLMFTDVDMPGGMDGLKLAATVRDRWPPIKIIVTSRLRQIFLNELPDESRFFKKPCIGVAVTSAMREMLA